MKLQNVKPTKFDNLNTQDESIKFLMDNIKLPIKTRIWECCNGNGNISNYLMNLGYEVTETDLNKGIDFLKENIDCDCIITNPPYSIKDKILRRCFELNKPFALLLPLTTLEGNSRNEIFRNKNIQILIPNKRFDFTGKKNCWFATAWFCYKLNLPNQLNFIKIKQELLNSLGEKK